MTGAAQPLRIERSQVGIIFGQDDGGFHVVSPSAASQALAIRSVGMPRFPGSMDRPTRGFTSA
jgi:hypothetical protein